ncbi:hypothetical protein FRC02_001003 [Tulasnella sp. 418]|nr:hypothetical protein FRC02_001003 [Tulasnella sp. 418]
MALEQKRNKGSPAPVNGMVNGSSNRAPTSGSSPFLPPPRQVPRKTGASPAPTGKPTYTVDDVEIDEVEDEDEIMEVESIPSRRSPKPRKTGTFSSGSKSSKRASPPPPIVVEELSNGGSSSSGKPSLVIEPDNNVRYARSPSLGPPGQQQRFHSPSIPSPLRLVSMPDEVEEEDDIEIIDRPKYSDDVDMDGGKPAAASVAGEWTCEVCGLKNPATAKDKCTVCGTDAPASFKGAASTSAPAPISAPPVVNNWAAAGWKPAASSAAGEWTCEVCGLKNPATVTDKCTVCASDAPPSVKGASATPASAPSSTPAPPVVNNWAAAGWKPSTSTSGEWTCNACDLKNPATEKEKCQICGEKAPASVNDSSSAPALGSSTNSAPLNLGPPTTSFNWTAAGLVQRALPAGGWKCPLCGLTNDAGDEKCKVCSQAKAS